MAEDFSKLTEADWRTRLTPMEYHVLREAGTERPGTGELLSEDREGVYTCRACGAELFRSDTKFESGCGWPSFYDPQKAAVNISTECNSHLGHVFPDAPQTPTGERYCMNSVALSFAPKG